MSEFDYGTNCGEDLMNTARRWSWLIGVLGVTSLAGCGSGDLPVLAPVTGKVTMDGQPLDSMAVEFNPEKGGKPGRGLTDADGNYELIYDNHIKGAQVGMNKVSVTTFWPEGEPPAGAKEIIPPKYNSQTTLIKEVKKGRNTIDIELTPETEAEAKARQPSGTKRRK
ncbi:MAG: hypothetical protein U0872_12740 [Planctomycetaceae bacterium]